MVPVSLTLKVKGFFGIIDCLSSTQVSVVHVQCLELTTRWQPNSFTAKNLLIKNYLHQFPETRV